MDVTEINGLGTGDNQDLMAAVADTQPALPDPDLELMTGIVRNHPAEQLALAF